MKIRLTIDIEVPDEIAKQDDFEDGIANCLDCAHEAVDIWFEDDRTQNGDYLVQIESDYMMDIGD